MAQRRREEIGDDGWPIKLGFRALGRGYQVVSMGKPGTSERNKRGKMAQTRKNLNLKRRIGEKIGEGVVP